MPVTNFQNPGMFRMYADFTAAGIYGNHHNPLRIIPSTETYGDTIALQIMVGCPFNRCTFCNFYKDLTYQEKSLAEIGANIDQMLTYLQTNSITRVSRVMLLDADALVISQQKLLPIFEYARTHFPRIPQPCTQIGNYDEIYQQFYDLNRGMVESPISFSSFIHTHTILRKGVNELRELKAAGLTHLWWGLETAAPNLLKFVQKEPNPISSAVAIEKKLIQAAEILTAAQIFYIPIILVGLGGMSYFEEHCTCTRKFLETIQPPGFCLSNLVVDPNSQYYHQIQRHQIAPLSPAQMQLQRASFESLSFSAIQFDYEI